MISQSEKVLDIFLLVACRSLSDGDFEAICEETLDSLADKFEDLGEGDFTAEEYDVNFSVSIHIRCCYGNMY